jgi:hypothetical protein
MMAKRHKCRNGGEATAPLSISTAMWDETCMPHIFISNLPQQLSGVLDHIPMSALDCTPLQPEALTHVTNNVMQCCTSFQINIDCFYVVEPQF